MKYPKVSIIILNWNGWKDTIECLESLFQISYPNYEVIVVDNASNGDDIRKIKLYAQGKIPVYSKFITYSKKNKPISLFEYSKTELENEVYAREKNKLDSLKSNKKLFILKNDKNYGFAEGNNIAIRQVLKENKSKYVLLLNNDTVVDKNFLDELVKVAESDDKIGIVGPIIHSYNTEKIDFAGGRINWWFGRPYHKRDETREYTDWITGCCMLIPTKRLKSGGLFDKIYFCYFEDTDLCERFKKRGFNLKIFNKSKIWHKISKSTEKHGIFHYYMARNRIIFNKKYNSRASLSFFLFFQKYIKRFFAKFLLDKKDYEAWVKGLLIN